MNLGVWFDSDFSFSCHVKNIYKACFVLIRDLKQLRGYLTCEVALLAANAFIGSHLDDYNSIYIGVSVLDFCRHPVCSKQYFLELWLLPPSTHISLL